MVPTSAFIVSLKLFLGSFSSSPVRDGDCTRNLILPIAGISRCIRSMSPCLSVRRSVCRSDCRYVSLSLSLSLSLCSSRRDSTERRALSHDGYISQSLPLSPSRSSLLYIYSSISLPLLVQSEKRSSLSAVKKRLASWELVFLFVCLDSNAPEGAARPRRGGTCGWRQHEDMLSSPLFLSISLCHTLSP